VIKSADLQLIESGTSILTLIDRAAQSLTGARSSAEILEARDMAGLAYDAAKRSARIAAAKGAHDNLIAASHRAQAHALEIETAAKWRLADEYDAAQERGDVQKHGGQGKRDVPNENIASVTDLGLTRKQIHEARELRDAETEDPGIVERVLNEALEAGQEPTRAKVKAAVKLHSKRKRKRAPKINLNPSNESQHVRDLRMIIGVWSATCESARLEFRQLIEKGEI
jgi:hypothetical protein